MVPRNIVYMDATGSFVKKNDAGKELMLYKIIFKQPLISHALILIAAVITESQSESRVIDSLTNFKHSKKLYLDINLLSNHCNSIVTCLSR